MNENICKLDKKLCTGCGACFNICPVNAISMQANSEGFLEPVIDEGKCTNCGFCFKSCPVINPTYENKNINSCYAYMADDKTRKNSTSGGAFPVLAKYFIENGGYVAGAVWTDNYQVKHIVSNNSEEIEMMRSSKYLQSDTNTCYKNIKVLLEDDKNVLFTGTPCQVAGLKSFLRKDYKNLFCIDIVCHGVPSPKVFKKYIEEEKLNQKDEVWKNTQFRDKSNGWNTRLITTTTNITNTTEFAQEDIFMKVFLRNLCLRSSCGSCKFSKIPRQGDITIGDFWGCKKKYNDENGTSVILVNNIKGSELLNILSKSAKLLVKQKLSKALKKNPNIASASKIHKDRNKFFKELDNYSLKELTSRFVDDKCDCMILNFWSAINYGAILTCYGVQCLIEKLGYYPKVINYIGYPNSVKCKDFKKSFSYKFANKYLNLTKEVKNYEDFYKLNKNCNTFISGSDQVWRKNCVEGVLNDEINWTVFLLDFVRAGKKKISYAPSIGHSEIIGTPYDYEVMNYYLSQFDAISIREDRGKVLLKNNFGIDATQVIDGAVHITKDALLKMTQDFKTDEKYIACFTLPYFGNQSWYKKVLKNISEKLDLKIKKFNFDYTTPVEKWLAYIRYSQFVITDSYHATIMAIMFNIPFVQIINNPKAQSRFDTLFACLNIENRTVSKYDLEPDYDKLLRPFDWDSINNELKSEREKAENWMLNALKSNIQNKNICPNFIEQTQKNFSLLCNKNKIFRKYYMTKFLLFFATGEKRKEYNELKEKLRMKVRIIRKLIK